MLDEAGGSDRAVTAKTGKGWNMFRAMAQLMRAKCTLKDRLSNDVIRKRAGVECV